MIENIPLLSKMIPCINFLKKMNSYWYVIFNDYWYSKNVKK